jgi:hypothetical protein
VVISAMRAAADAGIASVGPRGIAGHRLTQMRDFYALPAGGDTRVGEALARQIPITTVVSTVLPEIFR